MFPFDNVFMVERRMYFGEKTLTGIIIEYIYLLNVKKILNSEEINLSSFSRFVLEIFLEKTAREKSVNETNADLATKRSVTVTNSVTLIKLMKINVCYRSDTVKWHLNT